jgi:EAL domain-containing protein (putative c-di-GMP-specific phosphodiesterase class I)
MYAAKAKGKARAEFFEPSLRLQFLERLNLEVDLRKAIENNELVLHYQPIVALENLELVGFEALLRWQHPQRGLLYPGDFIALAEETNLIIDIGYWVIGEACQQMAAWNKQFDDGLTISINISGKHIADPNLYNYIQITLGETSLAPENLKLEITELTIVDQSEFTVRALSKLRDMGVQLQIDDFGIGYSSLSYLSRFPIDALKIDKSFVNLMQEDRSQADIIHAIITLTEQLNVDVIAEGIENADQLKELLKLNCKLGQGYLLSRPIAIRQIEAAFGNLTRTKNGRMIWEPEKELT